VTAREPLRIAVPVPVAVIGARGRLGSFACSLLRESSAFALVAAYGREDPWPSALAGSGALVALEATRAGQGFAHGLAILECRVRPVIATSGIEPRESDELDRRARELGLGGLVVPNFSLAAVLLQRTCAELARHFDFAEILELHHERKRDAPSGTALETARRIVEARGSASLAGSDPEPARGDSRAGVPIHSVRMPGLYAHQEVLFGAPGETLSVRHDMQGPSAFGPGILRALRYAETACGVGSGLELALG